MSVTGLTNTAKAISAAADILTAITALSEKLGTVSALLAKAHADGRDLTDAELASVAKLDDEARLKLEVAIAKAV